MTLPLNNFDEEVCDQFERFLAILEERDPPSLIWIKAQRLKPMYLGNEFSRDQIMATRNAHGTRIVGRALQHLVGDGGLQLPDGWKNDFAFNFDIVRRQVIDLFELGTWPVPGYSKRVGVLLRRANRRDLSVRIDFAWARIVHSSNSIGFVD